jgi:chromosome segregation ATPase
MTGGMYMNGNGVNREGFLAARDTIEALKGTLECLEVNLSQERDANEGLNLTIEALRKENENLQEKAFQLEAELVSLKQEAKDSEERKKDDVVPPSEIRAELEKKLGFYYKDLKNVDEKNLTAEDSETLYHILTYTFKTLKKAGLKF